MNKLVAISASLASKHFVNERSSHSQLAYLALGNIFLLASLCAFTSGFISSALFPNSVSAPSARENRISEVQHVAPFNRVVFLLIDALRSDFVYGNCSGFDFTQRHGIRNLTPTSLLILMQQSHTRWRSCSIHRTCSTAHGDIAAHQSDNDWIHPRICRCDGQS